MPLVPMWPSFGHQPQSGHGRSLEWIENDKGPPQVQEFKRRRRGRALGRQRGPEIDHQAQWRRAEIGKRDDAKAADFQASAKTWVDPIRQIDQQPLALAPDLA